MLTTAKKQTEKTLFIVLDGGDARRALGFVRFPPRFRYGFGVVVSPLSHAGRFLVTRWEDLAYALPKGIPRKNFRRTPDQRQLLDVPDAFSALRQTENITREYGEDLSSGEKAVLAEAGETARELNLTVLGLRPGTSIAETQAKLATLTEKFIVLLGAPIDLPKREARDAAKTVGQGRDSRSRPNPGALAARTVAARNRISEREAAIASIEPYIAARRRRILSLIHRAEHAMKTLEHFLSRLIGDAGWCGFISHLTTNQAELRLTFLVEDIRAIAWNPYREACIEIYKDVCTAHRHFHADRFDEARLTLETCLNALRLKRAQVELERWIFRLTWFVGGKQPVTAEILNVIHDAVNDIRAALTGVDESRFRKPVIALALRYLDIAHFAFSHPENYRRGGPNQYLRAAREAMKKASATL